MFSVKKSLYIPFFATLMTLAPACQAANIVFDLGGVLVDTKKMKALGSIGFFNLLLYAQNPTKLFFNYLDAIQPRRANTVLACDENGNLLPQLMCDWMTGASTGPLIAQKIFNKLDADQSISGTESRVIEGMSTMIFDDMQTYLETKKLIKSGIRFAQECKDAGHKLYILSNWDAASFDQLVARFPDFYKMFDGAIVSGKVGVIKPDPAIYQILIDTYHLNPQDTVFIDDQPENIDAANNFGITGILCTKKKSLFKTKPDFKKVRNDFYQWRDADTVAV